MSCNYPLRRAAGRLLFVFAAASSSPARPRPAAALRVPARGSAAASSRNETSGVNGVRRRRPPPLPSRPLPLELDGFIRVGSGCPKHCAARRGKKVRGRGAGAGCRGRGGRSGASRASGAGPRQRPLPSSPRSCGWRARPRRSSFLLARRLCFGDTRVFRSPARVERSQALHCSRVTANPAASVGARELSRAGQPLSQAAPACSRRPGPQSVTWRLCDRDAWAAYASVEAGGCTELVRFGGSKCPRPSVCICSSQALRP